MSLETLSTWLGYAFDKIKAFLSLPPEILVGCAAGLMILYLYIVIRHAYKPISLAKSDVGRIRVTRMALKSLVKTICKQVGLDRRISTSVEFSRNKVHVSVRLGKVDLDQNLTGLVNELQERLTQSLRNTLGVDNVGKVDILVSGFKEGSTSFNSAKEPASVEPDPFADFDKPA